MTPVAPAGDAVPQGDDVEWESVIGLEVHAELQTVTKLFCGCRNSFGDEPNTNVCPVCLGLPGSLPVLNRQAVELAMRIGTALHCEIRPSSFHRKNYFYPDMPKDYQISQYDEPINVGGWLETAAGDRVGIVRAHMEEDTGKTSHVGAGKRISDADHSLVDYNRAGVPLVEIVSEPDIRSPLEARAYVDELRAILVATGASDGRMEEGSVRVDANISVRPKGVEELSTRCEIKNLNSLRSLVRALEHERERQVALVSAGGKVVQETLHWDEAAGRTVSMRSKEEAYDYRYFPEPDLVPVDPGAEWQREVVAGLGLLPAERRARLLAAVGDERDDAAVDQVRTVVVQGLDDLVTAAVERGAPVGLALARVANEVAARSDGGVSVDPDAFAELLTMEAGGELSATQAKTVLAELLAKGGDPRTIAAERGFEAMSSDSLADVVGQVISENPGEWGRYLEGEDKLAGFFIGKVMGATKGRADGKQVAAELRARRG